MAGGFFAPLYTLYAIRELGMSPVLLGITIAIGGVSNLAGALAAPRVGRTFGLGATFLGSAVLSGAAALLIPAAHGSMTFAFLCMAGAQLFGDAFGVIYVVHETSLRQTITPEHLLGRVNSLMQLLTRGILPIGAIAGGLLAGSVGVRATLWIAAVGILVSVIWLLKAPIHKLSS
jgi:predicted MFS family arabinose efflux permease